MAARQEQRGTRQPAPTAGTEQTRMRPTYAPLTDIFETDQGFVLLVDMPGVQQDDLDVTLERHQLTIRGRTAAYELEGYIPVYREYESRDYERTFVLAEEIDAENIEARLKDGVLRLTLPKAVTTHARRIEVESVEAAAARRAAPAMGRHMMDLVQFVDAYADDRTGSDLTSLGPKSKVLYSRIGNEGQTRGLLATNFWRAWLASDAAGQLLEELGASPEVREDGRTIIVPRVHIERFDLVVLDPTLPADMSPRSATIEVSERELLQGAQRSMAEGVPSLIGPDAPDLALESANNGRQPFALVLAPAPANERLFVPSQPLEVADNSSSRSRSTAGVVVKDTQGTGQIGVTAALHGIGSATTVLVDGYTGTVVRSHLVTDSAFIALANLPATASLPTNGVMKGKTPRHQDASFVGANSGQQTTTRIIGWDSQIPTPSVRRQACVYTGRDAQPGDSGAALVTVEDTGDGWIIGFAFERSLPGQYPIQCSWIWAESVLNALSVELY